MNVLLLATIEREKYPINVYPIFFQGWLQMYGWYGCGHTNFCEIRHSTRPHSHTSKGPAILCMHTVTS